MRNPHLDLDTSASVAATAASATQDSIRCLKSERLLAAFYTLSFLCCVASSTSLGWVWQHWNWTLDVCAETDCGCVMYAVSGFNSFKGGEARFCLVALWSLAPPLAISILMGMYHGYRVLVRRRMDEPRMVIGVTQKQRSRSRIRGSRRRGAFGGSMTGPRRASAAPAFARKQSYNGIVGETPRRKSCLAAPAPIATTTTTTTTTMAGGYFDNEEDCDQEMDFGEFGGARGGVIVVGPKRRPSFKQWVPSSFVALILGCVCLGQAVLVTDGYASTCQQYRRRFAQISGANGNELQVINHRLGCGSIFDYMDYLHFDGKKERPAGSINTGILLQIALTASWLNFIFWVAIFVVNSLMARRRKKSLDEKIHCCL